MRGAIRAAPPDVVMNIFFNKRELYNKIMSKSMKYIDIEQ